VAFSPLNDFTSDWIDGNPGMSDPLHGAFSMLA
jgi:hypothetical protein